MIWEQYAAGEYIRLNITKDQARTATPSGTDVAPYVAELMQSKPLAAQIAELNRAAVVAYLQEFGAWDDLETNEQTEAGRADNTARLVWIACGDITEGDF
jgi:hypothetical protein